jgi:hypothetical protein
MHDDTEGSVDMDMDSDCEIPMLPVTEFVDPPVPVVPADIDPNLPVVDIDNKLDNLAGETLCYQTPDFSLDERANKLIDTVNGLEKNDFFQEGKGVDNVHDSCTEADRQAWAENAEFAYVKRSKYSVKSEQEKLEESAEETQAQGG